MAKNVKEDKVPPKSGFGLPKDVINILAGLNTELKDDPINPIGDNTAIMNVDRCRSGSMELDFALGGGWAYGKMNYISGWESSGKTTLALEAIAQHQKGKFKDKAVAFIDFEQAIDMTYGKGIGVDMDKVILAQPSCYEIGWKMIDKLSESPNVGVIVLDSIASAPMMKEIEGELGESAIGLKARYSGSVLNRIMPNIRKNNILFLVINQKREKIGVMYGSPETENGGNAWKFWQSIKLEIRKKVSNTDVIKDSDGDVIGNPIVAKVTKNKTAPPLKECEYIIQYGKGIDVVNEVYTVLLNSGAMQKKGSHHYLYDTETGEEIKKIGGSKKEAMEYIESDIELQNFVMDNVE